MNPELDLPSTSLGLRAWQLAERTRASGRWADRLANRPAPGLIKLGVNPGGRFVQRWLALPPGRMPLIQRLHHAEQPAADPGVWLRRAETLTPTRNRQAQAEPDGWSAGVMDRRPTVRLSQPLAPPSPTGSRPAAHPSDPRQTQWFSQGAPAPGFAATLTGPAWTGSPGPGQVHRALDLPQRQPLALSQARPLNLASMPPTMSTVGRPVRQPARSLDLLSRSLVPTVHDRPTSDMPQRMVAGAALGGQPISGASQPMATSAALGDQPTSGAPQAMAVGATLGMVQLWTIQRDVAATTPSRSAVPHSTEGIGSRPPRVQGQTVPLGNEAFSGIARRWTPSPSVPLVPLRTIGNSEVQLARRDDVRGVGHPFLSTHEPQREQVGAVRGSNRQGSTNYEPGQVQPAEGVPQSVVFPSPTVVGTQTAWVQPQRLIGGSGNWSPRASQRQTQELAAPPSLAQIVLQRLAQAPQAQREARPFQSDQALTPLFAQTQLAPAASQSGGSLLNPGGRGLNAASRKLGSNAAREQRAALDHPRMSGGPSLPSQQSAGVAATPTLTARPLVAPTADPTGPGSATALLRSSAGGPRQPLHHEVINRAHAMAGFAAQPVAAAQPVRHAFQVLRLAQPDWESDRAQVRLPFAGSTSASAPVDASQGSSFPSPGLVQRITIPISAPTATLAAQVVQRREAALGHGLPGLDRQANQSPLALSAQRPLAAAQVPVADRLHQGLAAADLAEAPTAVAALARPSAPPTQHVLSRQVSATTPGLDPVTPSRPMLADAPPQFGPNEPGPTLITPAPAVARGPELLRPITSVQRAPVELAATASLPDQAQLSLSSPAAAPASAAAAEPDLDALAQKVYERLQRRLRIDHERIGRY